MEAELEVDIAEALAARHGLVTALESGLQDIILELDNMKLFNHLKNLREASYSGSTVSDIRKLAVNFRSNSLSYVEKEGNSIACNLARLSLNYENMNVDQRSSE